MVYDNARRIERHVNCKKQDNFKSMCRSLKQVHGLTVEDEEEEYDFESPLFVGSITSKVQIETAECYVTLSVQEQFTRLKVDTGSQANIMPLKELKNIQGNEPFMEK